MAWTITVGTQTVTTTEHDMISDTSYDAGDLLTSNEQVMLELDASAMAVGDVFEIARRETIDGTVIRTVLGTLTDKQTEPFVTPFLPNSEGWAYTAKKIAGADAAMHWKITRIPE